MMMVFITTNFPNNYAILVYNGITYYRSSMFRGSWYVDGSSHKNKLKPHLLRIKIKI